jgi:transposase
LLFVGDDRAEDHHDVEVMDAAGRRLSAAKLPEGIAGITRSHAMIAAQLDPDGGLGAQAGQVLIGIETDRGPWVQALIAAGYQVYAVNPPRAARYRERLSVSGAKSDPADAHLLADMVRTGHHQLRVVAGDSELAEAVKVVTRAHKTLIWERTRHTSRMRSTLRECFPAALEAFGDLTAPDTLELLAKAPDPASAARLTTAQIMTALKRARRHHRDPRTGEIQAAPRTPRLGQPAMVAAAHAVAVRAQVAILGVLNERIELSRGQVEALLGNTRTLRSTPPSPAWDRSSAPGCWASSATTPPATATPGPARTTPDLPDHSPIRQEEGRPGPLRAQRPAPGRPRRAGLRRDQPITRRPGLLRQATRPRPGPPRRPAPARQLANRLVGILHGCLKTGTSYDETTAWSHRTQEDQLAAA